MDIHKICRICLKSDLLVSIFSPTFLLRPIEMIEKLNIFKVDDGRLANFCRICQSCLYRLLDAYNLQQLAIASERQLRQYLDEVNACNHEVIASFSATATKHISNVLPTVEATNFCDMFETRDMQDDGNDDVLNDVEIDVSSLTRSEAEDTLSEVFVDGQINCYYDAESQPVRDSTLESEATASKVAEVMQVKETAMNKVRKRKTKDLKKPEQCVECGKQFQTQGYLAIHKRIHTGEQPFKCKLCPRRFSHLSNFQLHQRVHNGERRFQCEICAKFFTTSSNLRAHNLTHKDQREFSCEHCEQRFKSARELRRHAPIHNAKREHNCEFCQKSFSKRCYLSAHVLTVHRNVRRYKCNDCTKIFATKSNLICHMRIHSGEKPYQCQHCNWKFNQSSALTRHMVRKHTKWLAHNTNCL